MPTQVLVALIGFPLVVMALYCMLPPRRAMLVAFVGGWLLLPVAGLRFEGLPEYTKTSAIPLSILLAMTIFDMPRLMSFRPKPLDVFAGVWLGGTFVSAMVNGLGPYAAMSELVTEMFRWGLPYFIGRVYLTDVRAAKDFALALVIGGLFYLPLMAYEVRMSPQLHTYLWGFQAIGFTGAHRFGMFRPAVFMQSGLMVGVWAAVAFAAALVLYLSRAQRRLWGLPFLPAVIGLGIGVALTLVVGAWAVALMMAGAVAALVVLRTKWGVYALAAIPLLYTGTRIPHLWDGSDLEPLIAAVVNQDRAESFTYRTDNEDLLLDKAMQQPLLGWGGHGRGRVYSETGEDLAITDGYWIISLGQKGAVGLIAMFGVLVVPAVTIVVRLRPRELLSPEGGPLLACALVPLMFAVDCLANAQMTPVYVVACGGLVTLASKLRPAAARKRVQGQRVARPAAAAPGAGPGSRPEPDLAGA